MEEITKKMCLCIYRSEMIRFLYIFNNFLKVSESWLKNVVFSRL